MNEENEGLYFYAVMSQDGKYYKSRGMGGYGDRWVDDLSRARIYPKIGQAKGQITYWSKYEKEYGIPRLVVLKVTIDDVLDQEEYIQSKKEKEKQREEKVKKNPCKYGFHIWGNIFCPRCGERLKSGGNNEPQ